MAPLTRRRATAKSIPTILMQQHYAERASAGLIIAEATQVSADAVGYPETPGIHNKKQMQAWQKICDAVHRKEGRIFLQLWHVGRHSHPDLRPRRQRPQAPSAIAFEGLINTGQEHKPAPIPVAMSRKQIQTVVQSFRKAAINAREAGFDGIEIHGANGYLIDQFLLDSTNHRNDEYGGSIENRSRFLFEILDAVSEVWSETRVGLRLSPSGTYHGMLDSNPREHFRGWQINSTTFLFATFTCLSRCLSR
jgi:N-ethylmaleimide reductase